MSQHHPCGNVPVTGIHLSAYYCWHHQAWWLHASLVNQEGDDVFDVQPPWSLELGPFDSTTVVARELLGKLIDLLTPPAAPWGSPAESALLAQVLRPPS